MRNSHFQNLQMSQWDVRQRCRAALIAHDPLINTLGLVNRLALCDFSAWFNFIWAADSFIVLSSCGNGWIRFLILLRFGSKTISFCGVSGAVCIKPPITNATWLCNGLASLVSAGLRMTFVFYVLNMKASHSQNLQNVTAHSGSRNGAWPSNQHSGPLQSSRCQPTGGRQVPSAYERCKQSESTNTETLLAAWMPPMAVPQNNRPIFYSTWLCNGFPSLVSAWLRMTFGFHSQDLQNVTAL